MRSLELFFGHGSFSRAALDMGLDIVGLDITSCPSELDGIEYYQGDILQFPFDSFPTDYFRYIWASPVCTTYSMGAVYRHRKNCKAISRTAKLHDSYVKRTIEIIKYFDPVYAVIENPRACLRKQSFMKEFQIAEVSYCQYEEEKPPEQRRMKPTDLFFYPYKPPSFNPKMCYKGANCHQEAKRGSKTGTQGLPQEERSLVPYALCVAIIKAMVNDTPRPLRHTTLAEFTGV